MPSRVILRNVADRKLRLYFTGVVSLARSKESILLGDLEGIPLYLGPGQCDKVSSPCLSVAWVVPFSAGGDNEQEVTAELKGCRYEIQLNKAMLKSYEGSLDKFRLALQFPYLQLQDTFAKSSADVRLVRALPDSPAEASGKPKGKGRGKSTAAKAANSLADLSKSIGSVAWLENRSKDTSNRPKKAAGSTKCAAPHLLL